MLRNCLTGLTNLAPNSIQLNHFTSSREGRGLMYLRLPFDYNTTRRNQMDLLQLFRQDQPRRRSIENLIIRKMQ